MADIYFHNFSVGNVLNTFQDWSRKHQCSVKLFPTYPNINPAGLINMFVSFLMMNSEGERIRKPHRNVHAMNTCTRFMCDCHGNTTCFYFYECTKMVVQRSHCACVSHSVFSGVDALLPARFISKHTSCRSFVKIYTP